MLGQKLLLGVYSQIFIRILQMLVTIIVARVVGPEVMGTIAFGLAFVTLFSFTSDLGLGAAHMKLISQGEDENECIGTFLRLKIFFVLVYIFIVLSYFFIQEYFLNGFETNVHKQVILIFIVMMILTQFTSIPLTTFAAKQQQAKQILVDVLKLLIYQILRLLVVLLGYEALAIAFSNLAATIIIIPYLLYLFRDYKIGNYNRYLKKEYIGIAIPSLLMLFGKNIIQHGDKLSLQYLTNSEIVGYYSVALGLASVIKMIESSPRGLIFAYYSEKFAKNQIAEINKKIKSLERLLLLYFLPFVLIGAIFSDTIILIVLGSDYKESIPVFSIVILALYISLLSLPYKNLLSGQGYFWTMATIWSFGGGSFIILAYVFVNTQILDLQAVGLSLALLVSNSILTILFIYISKKNNTQLQVIPEIKILLIGILFFLPIYFINSYFLNNILIKIVVAIISFIGYWVFLNIFNIMIKNDWIYLIDKLNLRKLKSYISSEVGTQK